MINFFWLPLPEIDIYLTLTLPKAKNSSPAWLSSLSHIWWTCSQGMGYRDIPHICHFFSRFLITFSPPKWTFSPTKIYIFFNFQEVPKFPKINDLSDLTDGVAVTSIMSLYCPDDMPWSNLALGMYGLGFTKNVTFNNFWSLAF